MLKTTTLLLSLVLGILLVVYFGMHVREPYSPLKLDDAGHVHAYTSQYQAMVLSPPPPP